MKSRKTWRERENIQSSPKSSRFESSSCQCSMTLSGKRMMTIVFRMSRKSRITRWKSRKDIRHSWVRGRKRSGMEILLTLKKENWDSAADEMVQRLTSSFPTNQCIETRNFEAGKVEKHHTLQWTIDEHRTLVPNNSFYKSAQYLRSSVELGSSIQFDRRRTGTIQILCGQRDVDKVTTGRSTTVGISSDNSIWKQDARERFELQALTSKKTAHTSVRLSLLPTSC